MFMRPVLVILPGRIAMTETSVVVLSKAMHIVASIVEEKMMYPGCVESVVVILDFEDGNVSDLPDQLLKDVIASLMFNFPNLLDELYIINPSLSLNWKLQYLTSIEYYSYVRGYLSMVSL